MEGVCGGQSFFIAHITVISFLPSSIIESLNVIVWGIMLRVKWVLHFSDGVGVCWESKTCKVGMVCSALDSGGVYFRGREEEGGRVSLEPVLGLGRS